MLFQFNVLWFTGNYRIIILIKIQYF